MIFEQTVILNCQTSFLKKETLFYWSYNKPRYKVMFLRDKTPRPKTHLHYCCLNHSKMHSNNAMDVSMGNVLTTSLIYFFVFLVRRTRKH